MLILFQWLFNLIIIISPIFGFFPQIIKVIKNKTDEGFNTSRVSLTYCSVFMEMLLNFSFNQTKSYSYKNQLEFLNHNSRLISLGIDWIGIILKIIVKNKYSSNKNLQNKHNKFIIFYSIINIGLFIPIIIAFKINWFNTLFSIFASFINFIAYLPQIKETYKLKKSGSLSYISVIFDYIGSFGIILYLITKDIVHPLTLIPVIISNLCITFLLLIMIYFDYGKQIKNKLNKYKRLEEAELNNIV
jgi:uncharacterized protein with PQ loop repeat